MHLAVIISSFNNSTREFNSVWRTCWQRVNPGSPYPSAHLHFGGSSWAMHVLDGTCPSYFNEAKCAWRFDRIKATIKEIACEYLQCQLQGLGLLHSDFPDDLDAFAKCVPEMSCWSCYNYSSALGDADGTYAGYILPFKETDCIETAFFKLWRHLFTDETCTLPAENATANSKCNLQGLDHGCGNAIGRIHRKLTNAEQKPTKIASIDLLDYIVLREIPYLEGQLSTNVNAISEHFSCSSVTGSINQGLRQQIRRLNTARSSESEPMAVFAACRAYLDWLASVRQQLNEILEKTP